MTLQQLLYALTIAEKGSMNKAAESLFISQPSLTLAMKDLEKELGITIFRRSSRGVELTNDGEDFLISARQIYQQYEVLKDKYSGDRNMRRKFAVSTQQFSFTSKAFVETAKQYENSTYDFTIRETDYSAVINDVGKMRSEIGVIYQSDLNHKLINKLLRDNDLEFTELSEDSVCVYLCKDHPLAGEESLTLSMLKDYPCVSFEQGDQNSLYFAEEIIENGEYEKTIRCSDRASMINMLVGLNGFTYAACVTYNEFNGGKCVAIPLKLEHAHKSLAITIGYITKKHSVLTDIGREFIRQLAVYTGK